MRKLGTIITGALGVAGLAVVLAVPAVSAASTDHGAMITHDHARAGACNMGTWYYAVHLQPGGLGAEWNPDADSGSTDACSGMWTTVQDNSGAQTHSGIVYGDKIWAWAYTHNNGSTSKAWVNWWNGPNPGGCAAERIIPSRGTVFNETCPSYAP